MWLDYDSMTTVLEYNLCAIISSAILAVLSLKLKKNELKNIFLHLKQKKSTLNSKICAIKTTLTREALSSALRRDQVCARLEKLLTNQSFCVAFCSRFITGCGAMLCFKRIHSLEWKWFWLYVFLPFKIKIILLAHFWEFQMHYSV